MAGRANESLARSDMVHDMSDGHAIERVEWTDSGMHMDHGWASTEVYRSSAREWEGTVITVGQLLHEDENVVVLGLSHDAAHDHWFGAQLINKAAITKRETLTT